MPSPALVRYEQRADAVNSLLCVGLDSQFDRLPAAFRNRAYPQAAFNEWIIEQTHPFVSAYKPNMAFYEARGEQGLAELRMTMAYLRQHHPDIFTICDAKRGDIASSNQAYAAAIFDEFGFDAVTLHPYVGRDALAPFLDRHERACIILCRTSNPGAGELQDLRIGDRPLWQIVAEKVSREWNAGGNCMLVVGATYPGELRAVRGLVGDMTLLIPGVGAQGGAIEAVVRAGQNGQGRGLIVNVSRGVLLAARPGDAARAYRDEINQVRQDGPKPAQP